MIVETRTTDVLTGAADLEALASYRLPVFAGCTDQDAQLDQIETIDFDISRGSGMIQVRSLLDLDEVYQQTHNPGTVGEIWQRHHQQFAEFIHSYQPHNVVEIGGGHGRLSQNYLAIDPTVQWTIIDPHASDVPSVTIVREFYTDQTQLDPATDAVVHSHFLEHIYNPTAFFQTLSKLPASTKLLFAVPALREHLEMKYVSALNFEHVYLCAENYVEYWLSHCGFQLWEKRRFNQNHSIFFAAEKTDAQLPLLPVPDNYDNHKRIFAEYLDYYHQVIAEVNQNIQNSQGTVCMFGAHLTAQYLSVNGLNVGAITCILDNDPSKQGKRLYGTPLAVKSPQILRDQDRPVVILLPSAYTQEVKRDILDNINPTTVFLEYNDTNSASR